MTGSRRLAGLLLCAALGPAMAQPDQAAKSAANIRAHMAFLASDRLQGREAGSPGYDMAARYVADQMKRLGLTPKGKAGGWFQPVPLLAYRPRDPGSLILHGPKGTTPLVFGTDYVTGGQPLAAELKLDAKLVFAGFGLVAPEHGRDDYRGLDVRGKIVVTLFGAPKFLQSEERAYYTSTRVKLAAALAHGAAGMITVETPVLAKMSPFANRVRQYRSWGMTWRTAAGKPFVPAPLPSLGLVSGAGAKKLFAGAPLDKIMAAAATNAGAVRGFALPLSLAAVLHTELKPMQSENIVGLLPGADPKLKNEYVVLSAHLDHLGITPPVKGDAKRDTINNGALDNAAGVATTLEVARLLRAGKPPRRSVLFLVDTAEEKGLIGAEYFARNPTVPLSAITADVDLDMPILTYDFTDVVAFGADRSSIGPAVKRAAARMNVKLSPDPTPDEGIFTRSDHYRFVEQGVPAVFLVTGPANGGAAAFQDFLQHHYHKPSDDLSLPILYDAGAKFARLNYEVTRELADGDARAAWNRGDFFGGKFGKR